MLQRIVHQDNLVAVIIRRAYYKEGIEFFTPSDFSQQLAYMKRPAGYKIDPHVHNKVTRQVHYTQEVLFIKSGKVKVDFYSSDGKKYIQSETLGAGDTILLASGGHGFTFLKRSEIIEVKQGPYISDEDKIKFEGI